MATNKVGQVRESIWRDKDFRALSRGAQCTYLEVISQSSIDRAGVQPLQVTKLAKGCDSITVEDIWSDLKELQASRFVFFDDDTEELFVRSYMRTCEVWKVPNTLKSAIRAATVVASEMIRHELAEELRRLRRAEATKTADEIDPGEEFAYRSETQAEPIANPSATLPDKYNPSGTHPEPTGTGMGIGKSLVPEIESFRAGQSNPVATKPPAGSAPPPQTCPKHPNGTTDNCGPCGEARRTRQAWDADRLRAEATARSAEARHAADLRALAIDNCDSCDEDGYRGSSLCDHDPDGAARAARGMALVRASLAKPGADDA